MDEKKSFFQTLPGIFTGIAALITALTGLYIAMNRQAGSDWSPPVATPPTQTQPTELAEQMRGVWVNVDANTRGVTRVVVLRKDGHAFVRAWGKCHPEDCYWGESPASSEGSLLKVTWRWTAGERDMSLRLDGTTLNAETVNVYDDKRPPRESREHFKRSE